MSAYHSCALKPSGNRYPVYSFFLPIYSFWCMDDFSWGNTRLVIGEGSNKKVILHDDEKFDDSMIPLKKFSGTFSLPFHRKVNSFSFKEYEAEAWETATRHSDETGYDSKGHSQSRTRSRAQSRAESPHSFHQASQAGDYYRDTNLTAGGSNSQHNLRGRPSQSNMSMYNGQPPMSQYGLPQLPFMPFAGGPGTINGSEYGGHLPPMPAPITYQNTGSMYGMVPNAPRNTVMTNVNMFGSGDVHGSQSGFMAAPPSLPLGMEQRPMSTFSLATSVNPFAGPSMNPDPSDDDLINALRNYLSTQDLMTVTKK